MTGTVPQVARYRFGPFVLDPEQGTLTRNGMPVKLQDLPYRLLRMLVERPGEIVTREEVRQHLWPENTFVEFDNSLGVAIRKVRESLNDNAEAPNYVATIPRRGYRFVAPVTVQGPEKPAEIRQSPAPPTPRVETAASTAPDKRVFQPHWAYWLAAGSALLLGVLVVSFRFHFHPPYVSPDSDTDVTAQVRVRRSVAVLGFRNLPGHREDDWLSPVFAEMLDTELGTRGDLRMVSGEDVARAKRELPPTEGDSLAKATLDRLRKNPGADMVVLGSYTPMPGKDEKRIRLDIRVQDTADGETIAEEAITGDRDNLFDLAARAGARLRQRMGLSPNSLGEASAARVALPSNQRSARLYVDGRAKLWAFDFLGARDLLIDAVATDDKFPLAHSALSEAWWHLGYQEKARVEAQRARELSQELSQEDRLLIEGQYWRSISDWPKTVQTYRTLFHLYPDSLDYGILLATAQIYIQPAAASQTLATLRRLPAPAGDDARIDMTEASAWIGQDFAKARAAARTAIAKGQAQGNPVLVARTYGFLCQQSAGIGESMQQAINDCESARRGAVDAADRNSEAIMLTDLAVLYFEQGDIARSEAMLLTAISQFREVGNQDGIATAMSNLGSTHLQQGDLIQARKFLEGSITNYEAIEDKEGVALALNDLADLSRRNGKLSVAEADFQRAKATAEEIDNKSAVAYVLTGLGDVFADRGDLAAARRSYEQSLGLRNQIGEKQMVGETQLAMARISIEEGRAAEIEQSTRHLKDQFHQERQADDELVASIALTEALLAQGRQADARIEMEQSQDLATKSQNLPVRLQYDLASSHVLIASDHPEVSRPRLEKILKQARAHGLVGIELEALLAVAELEKRSGHAAIAQAQLTSLERAAREKGFGLVARKAAAARA
jgi:DNA-binding winged helix-turn-helix (wHTH) protein/tetratricopeptide (TPR) repeat protein